MQFHLFGSTTPVGESFRHQFDHSQSGHALYSYSRSAVSNQHAYDFVDFSSPDSFLSAGVTSTQSIWISFAPIWLLAPFLERLATHHPDRLQGLRGVIACSSSSSITKRFAANPYDRQLVAKLVCAENQLLSTCKRLSIPCRILRPTMIYGQVGCYTDNNLSLVLSILRRFPCILLPAQSGMRQPIHASQLATLALHLAHQLNNSAFDPPLLEHIAVGGDTTLTYREMIIALQNAQPAGDPARRCRVISIPSRLFFLLSAPLLLFSFKTFEAMLRMGANLDGFTPAYELLGSDPQPFPVRSPT